MEREFDCRKILVSGGLKVSDWDFACQRDDGSIYGINPAHQCRQGTPVDPKSVGITRESWRKLGEVYGPETTAAIKKLEGSLGKLGGSDKQAPWEEVIADGCVDTQIVTKLTGDKTLAEADYDSQMAKRLGGYEKLIREGPPEQFTLRNGDPIDVPNPQPVVTGMGQGKWVNPETGMRHSHSDGRQVATGAIDVARRAADGAEYREKVLANPPKETNNRGDKWPVQQLPESQRLDPDKIIAGLSNAEKYRVAINGLSMTKEGSAQNDVFKELTQNPAMRDKRLREIVERYAEQGGRSGVSGKPVALPGLRPKPGEETSSVDHHTPISTAKPVSKGGSVEGIRGTIDNKKNFLIAEESLNKQRSDRNWNTEIGRMKAAADADVASGRAVGNPKSFATLGERKGRNRSEGGTISSTRRSSGISDTERERRASARRGRERERQAKAKEREERQPASQAQKAQRKAAIEGLLEKAKKDKDSASIRQFETMLKTM